MNREVRSGHMAEARMEDDELKVAGYAATFGTETNIGGMYLERIEQGAFTEAVMNDDVRFLINHEGLPLARTKSNTLRLLEDVKGLYMEANLDASDPDVMSIASKMRRNDLNEMSFAFISEDEEWDESGDMAIRTIKKAKLFDVAIVTYPAYSNTEIGLRKLEQHREKEKLASKMIKVRMKMKLALS